MTKKHFPVSETHQSEEVVKMPFDDVQKHLQNDGYDEMRQKVWSEGMTERQFTNGLAAVERTIVTLKARKDKEIVYPTYFKELLEDRILVLADDAEVMTSGGIYIPDQAQNAPARGTVVGAGPGKPDKQVFELVQDGDVPLYKLVSMPLKRGDKVLYGKQAGLPVEDPNTKIKYLIMRVTDCFIRL